MAPFHVHRPWDWVSAERLAPLIEQWLTEGNLVEQLDANDIRIAFAIRHHERESVNVVAVDRLLVGMQLSHYWHLPPEDGGFSDIYFHERIVGNAA